MMTSSSRRGGPAIEQLEFLYEALGVSAALATAERLGVLQRLGAGPTGLAGLARDCTIDQRSARLLLGALVSIGIVEATGDGSYRPVEPDLTSMLELWDHIFGVTRGSRPLVTGDGAAGAGTRSLRIAPRLGTWFAEAAELAAGHLWGAGLQVLDMGAGSAPWSLALTRRDPNCHVTAVDFPTLLEFTRGAVAAAGCESQFRYLGGDLLEVDVGCSAYDLAIAGHLCHLFDEAANRRMFRRLFNALRPGATVAILDALPNEHLDGPRLVMLYGLGLLWRTEAGQIYPFSVYAGWLRDAGYANVERVDLVAFPPISLITAHRP